MPAWLIELQAGCGSRSATPGDFLGRRSPGSCNVSSCRFVTSIFSNAPHPQFWAAPSSTATSDTCSEHTHSWQDPPHLFQPSPPAPQRHKCPGTFFLVPILSDGGGSNLLTCILGPLGALPQLPNLRGLHPNTTLDKTSVFFLPLSPFHTSASAKPQAPAQEARLEQPHPTWARVCTPSPSSAPASRDGVQFRSGFWGPCQAWHIINFSKVLPLHLPLPSSVLPGTHLGTKKSDCIGLTRPHGVDVGMAGKRSQVPQ